MTREEGNKLIRVFMGLPETSEIVKGDKLVSYCGHYDSQWGELMPVVEKIPAIIIKSTASYNPDYSPRIEIVPSGYVKINDFKDTPIFSNVAREGSLISATWKAVVQFIQWYNQASLESNKIK